MGNATNWNVTNGLIEKNFTPAFNEDYCNAANKTTEIKLMVEAIITKSYEGNVIHCVALENDGDKLSSQTDPLVIPDTIGEYHAELILLNLQGQVVKIMFCQNKIKIM